MNRRIRNRTYGGVGGGGGDAATYPMPFVNIANRGNGCVKSMNQMDFISIGSALVVSGIKSWQASMFSVLFVAGICCA